MTKTKNRSIKGIVFSVVFTMTALSATPVIAGTPSTPRAVAAANTMVWETATGKCYHSRNNCGKTNPKKAEKILFKTWQKSPSWLVYLAYKEAIKNLPEKKRLKSILALTKSTRDERYSLLARADMDIDLENWARAKENLENYLQKYPLTHQVASMMATVERMGWHHEEIAQEWENKAVESEDDSLWICENCAHSVADWQILCPHCNAFDTLYYK